jgi:hypothetical protein
MEQRPAYTIASQVDCQGFSNCVSNWLALQCCLGRPHGTAADSHARQVDAAERGKRLGTLMIEAAEVHAKGSSATMTWLGNQSF